jgi:uncharacterized membrane protein YhaH (DUF805 family)
MRLSDLFIGRPVYWALLAVIIAVLGALGLNQQHVRDFIPFSFILLALAAVAVAAVILLYRPGERITREPIDGETNDAE